MARGKSLKIFMMDGNVVGRWICTLAGRTTKAYRIPRALYKKCEDIDVLKRPAVYLLFGDEDDSGRPVVYVGETEDAYTRLKDHEDKKDYWSEAVVFVSQDDHFNKRSDRPHEMMCISIDYFMDRLEQSQERCFDWTGVVEKWHMVKKIVRDPLFLAQKSVDATEADKQVVCGT